MLDAIKEACRISPWLDVRIIVAKPFPGRRYEKEAEAIEAIARTLGLRMGEHVRILNPKYFVHCHNKLLVVDDQFVLISSQNWSDAAITRNREAGLWIDYPELASYYSTIFKSDWDSALQGVPPLGQPEFLGPESLASGKTVSLNLGDYLDV